MKTFMKFSFVLVVWVVVDLALVLCYMGFDAGVERALKRANLELQEGRFQPALDIYRNVQSNPFFMVSGWKEYVNTGIKDISQSIEREAQAKLKLDPLLARTKNGAKEQYAVLSNELKDFILDYDETAAAAVAAREYSRLQREMAVERQHQADADFSDFRAKAEQLVNQGRYDEAVELYRTFVKGHRDISESLMSRIRSELKDIRKLSQEKK
ncbi:MAG: hypothetical protein WC980_04175 [Candidatus Brocadiia bacterium]